MKFRYKGCTYRTENLTEKQREVMKVEIGKTEAKNKRLNELADNKAKKTADKMKAKKSK